MNNDRECWDKIRLGDGQAFGRFYQENAPRLTAFLRHLVRSSQTAEDIVQDTFAQIWNKPRGFDPERGTLRSYLYGIGRKRAAEWWRQRKPESAWGEATENRDAIRDAIEAGSIMGDAFGRLPEHQRTLLWLREVEGQSYAELAVVLEVPVGTVRSRLFAAREALRQIWHGGDNARKEQA